MDSSLKARLAALELGCSVLADEVVKIADGVAELTRIIGKLVAATARLERQLVEAEKRLDALECRRLHLGRRVGKSGRLKIASVRG